MTKISTSDQVLLLLREQLARSERKRSRDAAGQDVPIRTPQRRVETLAAIRDLPEREFRRALVRGLLGERLGEALVAEPAFDSVTGEVLRIIEGSEEASALLDRVAADLRGG